MNEYGANGLGYKTAAAGTEIIHQIPPSKEGVVRITSLSYLDTGTAHGIYILRELAKTTLASAAISGATTFTGLTAPSPTTFVANGFCSVECDGGVTHASKITSWTAASGTLIIGTGLTAAAAAGNRVWNHGNLTATDAGTGLAHPYFLTVINTTLSLPPTGVPALIAANKDDSPVLVISNNPTAAGKFNALTYCYARPS